MLGALLARVCLGAALWSAPLSSPRQTVNGRRPPLMLAAAKPVKGKLATNQAEKPAKPQLEPCNIVLTHSNADFDSLAAAVALAKLWTVQRPEVPTHVVLPRGANPLASRFLAYHKHLFPIRGFGTINPADVRMIGVCDTQTRDRVGPAAAWLEHATHIAVYDHHEYATTDLNPDELVVEAVGSTTTLLVEMLQALSDREDAHLSEAEATLFSLGIRADTGALAYTSTTPRDGEALVWLMRQGASQSAISEFGQARLSDPQREILTDALSTMTPLQHHGLKIGTVFTDTGRGFVTGLAGVAGELMELASYDVVLMGVVHRNAKQKQFLSLIGRCSTRAFTVDLNAVMQTYGGGGHPMAAAASVAVEEDRSPTQILHQLVCAVKDQVPEQVCASDVMSKSIASVLPEDTMGHALELMRRIERKGAPVVDSNGLLMGMLKYRDVMKADQTGKADQLVKAWMRRQVPTVPPDMRFDELEEFLIERSIGRLPVVDEAGCLLGLVTRTDVLRQHNLYSEIERDTAR